MRFIVNISDRGLMMENEQIQKLYKLLESIEITEENEEQINEVRELLESENYEEAIPILKELTNITRRIEMEEDDENKGGGGGRK